MPASDLYLAPTTHGTLEYRPRAEILASGLGYVRAQGGRYVLASGDPITDGINLVHAAPPAATTISNDGDAFNLTWAATAGATEYVVQRAAAATGRQFVPINMTTLTATSFRDNTVYDGLHVYYRVQAVVGGVEVLIAELDGIQTARVWVSSTTLGTLGSGTYDGLNIRMDTYVGGNTGALAFTSGSTATITNCRIASVQHAIHGFNCKWTIRNTRMWSLYPGGDGRLHGKAINAENGVHLDVQNCLMDGFFTTEMKNYAGNHTAANTYIAMLNIVRNVQGRKTSSTTADGYQDYTVSSGNDSTFARGQAFLFNGITGVAGVEIAWNWVHNEPGFSRVEDNINTFRSSGTSTSALKIHDNYINGAYAAFPFLAAATYFTGGGIITGDVGSGYALIENNLVVACTNYSLGLVGGDHGILRINKVVRSARSWGNQRHVPTNNNGIQYYDYNNAGASVFHDNSVTGNTVGSEYETATGVVQTHTAYATAQNITGANNTYSGMVVTAGPITPAMEYATFKENRDKVTAAGLSIGPTA